MSQNVNNMIKYIKNREKKIPQCSIPVGLSRRFIEGGVRPQLEMEI